MLILYHQRTLTKNFPNPKIQNKIHANSTPAIKPHAYTYPAGKKHALNCRDTSGAVLILCPSISMAPNPGVQSPRVTLESPWLRQQSPH